MKMILKKMILLSMILSLVLGLSSQASATTTDYTPTVKVKKSKDTYVTLQITSSNLKRKDVKIRIKKENLDNDSEETITFEKTLSKTGKVDVKIEGLTKENEYSFKVAIKKSSDDEYSDYSDEVKVNAQGTFDYNPTLSIKNETANSVVLNIASDKLKKKKVRIKIRIENVDTDKIETRIITKNLSKNGKAEITVDNLSKNTDYKFKVALTKKGDKGFSEFSGEESATTED